ncbi:MAG: SO_0444 family Cu/Zn efflux transporter [Phycisphaerae bacterium]
MAEFLKTLVFDFWATLAEMAPYLLFGFLVAGALSVLISQRIVERHLGGKGIWPLAKASLFGVPLPLCSCGVIPVSMSLHKHGAGKGSTISFLLSTPQTGVDSIFVTYSLMGPVFAIFRPLAAFATGIIGGSLVNIFDPPDQKQQNNICKDQCCSNTKENKFKKAFRFAFVTLPRDIGGAMIVGLIIAAFISALVPEDYFMGKFAHPIIAMLVMMVLGIPVYVCATASVPIAAALIGKGLDPGAALVFLMTGPATNAASFTTIYKGLGGRTAILYLISVAGCALAAGLTLNSIISGLNLPVAHHHGWMLPQNIKNISAVVLLLILLQAIVFKKKPNHKTP